MKNLLIVVCAVTVTVLFTGCVPITYKKTVATHIDGSGKVTETVVTEEIIEPHTETPRIKSPAPMNLNHIGQ